MSTIIEIQKGDIMGHINAGRMLTCELNDLIYIVNISSSFSTEEFKEMIVKGRWKVLIPSTKE